MWTALVYYVERRCFDSSQHLAVKCSVLHSLTVDGVHRLFEKMLNDTVSANMWVSLDWLHLCCYHGHRCLSSAQHTMWRWGAAKDKQPSGKHLYQTLSQHHQRGGGLWLYSPFMMFVNTNVKMQKHILSFIIHGISWFLVIIPADILQWFKEVRR